MGERDVVVLGGGLAGLSLGIQMLRARPHLNITVLERARFPRPEAAHKVGESTVEIGALYFADTLGMREILVRDHLPKFGLRFFFSDGSNQAIDKRSEYGLRDYLPVRSFQVDRGLFENQLAARFSELGGELLEDARVDTVDLDGQRAHTIRFHEGGQARTLRTRWVVDASGRRGILKGQLKLGKRTSHEAVAAWWRVPGTVDIDTWSDDPAWRSWPRHPRRLSTNHLLGEGYWAWLIPLPGGQTSIGIVGDESLHPAGSLRTPDRADAWMAEHEPQLARELAKAGPRQDFLFLRRYTHAAKQLYSPDRWALTGDAGIFLDPFYSPGSDFIGLSNSFVVDCIEADLDDAPDLDRRIEGWNLHMLRLFRAFLTTYRGRYPLMGRPEVMRAKLLWDYSFYWSGQATLFGSGKLTDPEVARETQGLLIRSTELHLAMQQFLGDWGEHAPRVDPVRMATDYGTLPGLVRLNRSIQATEHSAPVVERLRDNIHRLEQLAADIQATAQSRVPSLRPLAARDLPEPHDDATSMLLAPAAK